MRNTEWVIGVCVFTGHETKIMMNSSKATDKQSKLEIATEKYLLLVVLIQFLICLVAAIVQSFWASFYAADTWYLSLSTDGGSATSEFFITFGTWFVNMMNLVPISLIVTLEMVKFIQAYFINQDVSILDEERDIETKVQSSNLNEELGMVHNIFSDKTGTLTQNIMEFKKFSAGNVSYGVDDPAAIAYDPGVTNVNF